jgi:2-oxoacid:acceptor oxidoreductase delta subunit (pyruvate/2-ketoisovalerate family)
LKTGRDEVEETTWVKDFGKIGKKPARHMVKKGELKPKVSFEEAEKTLQQIKRKARFEAFRCLGCGPCAECLAQDGLCTTDNPLVNESLCTGCGTCISLCPFGALSKNTDGIAQVDKGLCKGCGICAAHCPENAIAMEKLSNEKMVVCASASFGE